MKSLNTLITILILFTGSLFSQITINQYDSLLSNNQCPGIINTDFYILATNPSYTASSQLTVNINYGDGTTAIFTGGTYNPSTISISYWLSLSHSYTIGTYYPTITVTDEFSNTSTSIDTIIVSDDCGILSVYTNYACSSSGISAPIKITSASSVITTLNTDVYGFATLYNVDLSDAPYTIEYDPAFLTTSSATGSTDIVSFSLTTWESATISLNPSVATYDSDISMYSPGIVPSLGEGKVYISSNHTIASCTTSPSINNYTSVVNLDPAITGVVSVSDIYGNVTGLTQTLSGSSLTLNYNTLNNLTSYFLIEFSVSPTTPLGQVFNFTSNITNNTLTESNFANNNYVYSRISSSSYDPNDKSANKTSIINPAVDDVLDYTINFQNLGTYYAKDVVIKDTLSSLLDLSTFKVIASKHTDKLSTSIDPATRIVTFTFTDIWLNWASSNEEESKGFVTYSIKENVGNLIGSEINNTGYIYFDLNPAIITNTTSHLNSDSVIFSIEENSINYTLYPNPTTDVLNIVTNSNESIDSIAVTDLNGKILIQITNSNQVNVSSLVMGMYLITVNTNSGTTTKSFLKK